MGKVYKKVLELLAKRSDGDEEDDGCNENDFIYIGGYKDRRG